MSSISAANTSDLGTKISMNVAKKSLDVTKSQGAAAVQMIKDAAKISEQAHGSRPGGGLDVTG